MIFLTDKQIKKVKRKEKIKIYFLFMILSLIVIGGLLGILKLTDPSYVNEKAGITNNEPSKEWTWDPDFKKNEKINI